MAQDPPSSRNPESEADRFEVRIFTIADWAESNPNGKIYIGGGSVTTVRVPSFPAGLPPLYLVAAIKIPRRMIGNEVEVRLRVLDFDGMPIEADADPIAQTRQRVEPKELIPGEEINLQFALSMIGFPVREERVIFFALDIAGELQVRLPLRVSLQRPATQEA